MPTVTNRISSLLVALLGLAAIACDESARRGSTSTPTPTPSPTGATFTVTGRVLAHAPGGTALVPGLRLQIGLTNETREVTSDAQGRFTVTDVPPRLVKIEPAPDTAYRAPCPSGSVILNADAVFDLHVVQTDVLSTVGTPASLPRSNSGLLVTGTIYESTAGGARPLAGAEVSLDNYGFVLSTTMSDANGRYLLCSFPPESGTDQRVLVQVRKSGFRAVTAEAVFGDVRDVSIARQ